MSKQENEERPGRASPYFSNPLRGLFWLCWMAIVGLIVREFLLLKQEEGKPIYYFSIDQKGLEFAELGSQRERLTLLAHEQPSDIGYQLGDEDQNQNAGLIKVVAGTKKFTHRGKSISGVRFFPEGRTLFFWQITPNAKDGLSEVWQWDETKGFRMLFKRSGLFYGFVVSPDMQTICAGEYVLSHHRESQLVVFSMLDQEAKDFPVDLTDKPCAVINKDFALVSAFHGGFFHKTEHDLIRIDLRTGARSSFLADQGAFTAATFDGSLWCLCFQSGKYSAVRLNKSLDTPEERIDLTNAVGRPWLNQGPSMAAE